jgi:RND family efflux transporter MFP subunit
MDQRLFLNAAVLMAAAGLASCRGASRDLPRATREPVRQVRLGAVVRSGGEGLESVPAVIAAKRSATLASRIPSAVVALPFREGERVSEGAVVVRLDAAALRSSELAAETALKAAEADLARTQALLAKNAATPREQDEAEARAAAARAALLGVRDNLAYAVLRAPFSGVVAARPVHVGDVVSSGMPLLEIEGDGGLEIRATVEGGLAASLSAGQRLSAEVDGQGAALVAIVRAISPAADPTTHRVEVRADLPSTSGLRSGLFARLQIPRPGMPPRLTVPSSAVVERGGLSGVFVVSEGRARLRWVGIGESRDGATELRAGAEAGERVVLEPAGLADGQRVDGAR